MEQIHHVNRPTSKPIPWSSPPSTSVSNDIEHDRNKKKCAQVEQKKNQPIMPNKKTNIKRRLQSHRTPSSIESNVFQPAKSFRSPSAFCKSWRSSRPPIWWRIARRYVTDVPSWASAPSASSASSSAPLFTSIRSTPVPPIADDAESIRTAPIQGAKCSCSYSKSASTSDNSRTTDTGAAITSSSPRKESA
jgi:hypothetical protein